MKDLQTPISIRQKGPTSIPNNNKNNNNNTNVQITWRWTTVASIMD